MTRKFSAARKRAFLNALADTGNQTLSAERAKVSRSWVGLHRSADPLFDAACAHAIDQVRERLTDPLTPTLSLQGRAGFQAGVELVVSGTNGVRTQVRRAKLRQWTPRVEKRFLEALAASCNVRAACAAIGFAVGSAYARRNRLPAFARAWEDAISIGMVRLEAVLIQNIDFAFDPDAPPPETMLAPVTVMDAIRTLRMYEKRRR